MLYPGLKPWADMFGHVVVSAPKEPEILAQGFSPGSVTKNISP